MPKRSTTISLFFFLCFLSILILFLSRVSFLQSLGGVATLITAPIQGGFYQLFGSKGTKDQISADLIAENAVLRKNLVDQKKILAENNALKDQFKTMKPASRDLLPARVLGAPGFMPGVSLPEMLIVDKGVQDGVEKGQAVVVNDTVIGTVATVSERVSVVSLLESSDMSFTAKTLETKAVGVVYGGSGETLSLQNVLLSQKLKHGDVVLTKGDIDKNGKGFPPDLLVGRIIAIDKKPSALFQTAKLKSLVDVSGLSTVFIISTYK